MARRLDTCEQRNGPPAATHPPAVQSEQANDAIARAAHATRWAADESTAVGP